VSFFKNLLGKRNAAAEEKLVHSNKRAYDRYDVSQKAAVNVFLENNIEAKVVNISYGGLAIDVKAPPPTQSIPDSLSGKICIFDQSIQTSFKVCRKVKRTDGSLFLALTTIHEQPESLIFLREFIELYRSGMSLAEISPKGINPRFKSGNWKFFRGDGPLDVWVRQSPDFKGIEEALIVFKIGSDYCEIQWREGQLSTSKEMRDESSPMHVGSQMASTRELDLRILRLGLNCLAGSGPVVARIVEPLYGLIYTKLGLKKSLNGGS
jgi:hypothetical protein